jgi:SAM-dependent methyltransferase
VEAGNRRARSLGLSNLSFQEGDASNLEGLAANAFDLVVSIFGAMFAPRPGDVAKEMVRVTKPGGRIIMGNWIPGDPTLVAQILKISSAYSPPPPEGFVSPMLWGVDSEVAARFGAAGIPAGNVRFSRETYTFNFAGPPAALVDAFRDFYGPTMNAYEAARTAGKEAALHQELNALFAGHNKSTDKSRTSIPATFLKVTVTKG